MKSTSLLALGFVCVSSIISAYAVTPNFVSPQVIPATGSQVVSGDFNHDGAVDFAIAGAPGLTVILSDGQGGFQFPTSYKVKGAVSATGLAVADVNNDGAPDIVVFTNADRQYNLEVFLNNGFGVFPSAPKVMKMTQPPTSIAVGDFNGDGNQDVALSIYGGVVGIFLGQGNGTFQPEVDYRLAGKGPSLTVKVGDINGDGKLDLVASDNNLSLLLGNGDGTFQTATLLSQGGTPYITLYDVNGDGHLDLVFGEDKGMGVALNQGDGTFGPIINSPAASLAGQFVDFTLGDFNGDGKVDVALSDGGIMLGIGDGHFHAPPLRYADFGSSLIAADANSDGKLDVIGLSAGLLITRGYGDGTMRSPRYFLAPPPWGQASQIALGDFNNDGKNDVAVLEGPQGNDPYISIFVGDGTGGFTPLHTFLAFSFANFSGFATGDFNHDGKLDLVVWNSDYSALGQVAVFLGNGDGTFQAPIISDAGYMPVAIAVGDFNKDGKLDVAVADSCTSSSDCSQGVVNILLGQGNGSFTAGSTLAFGASPNSIVAADFNGDGILDLAAPLPSTNGINGTISVWLGVGNGTFQAPNIVQTVTQPFGIQAADMNNDGEADLIVGDIATKSLAVLLGAGNGKFGTQNFTPLPAIGVFTIADFNGDGKNDIAVLGGLNSFNTLVYVATGLGTGRFNPATTLFPGGISIASGLLGNDALPDILTGGGGVYVLTNQTK